MPHQCEVCNQQVEPIPLGFRVADVSGWFLVCPICHFVFEKHAPEDLLITPSDAPDEWVRVY